MTEKNKNGSKSKRAVASKSSSPKKSKEHSEKNQEALPLPPEVIEKLPDDAKVHLQTAFSMMRISGVSPASPLMQKLTPEHLTTIISAIDKDNERQYDYAKSSRKLNFGYTIIAISVFIFLTIYFGKSDQSLYLTIVQILVVLGGGIGIGIGLYRIQKQEEINPIPQSP